MTTATIYNIPVIVLGTHSNYMEVTATVLVNDNISRDVAALCVETAIMVKGTNDNIMGFDKGSEINHKDFIEGEGSLLKGVNNVNESGVIVLDIIAVYTGM